jgi:hypothetical protein
MLRLRICQSLAVVLLFAVPSACGGDDSDDDDSAARTPATCPDICAQQNRLCGSMDDCSAFCPPVLDMLQRTGCMAPFQEELDCLSAKNVCDDQETACPETALNACLDTFCQSNPADPVCA